MVKVCASGVKWQENLDKKPSFSIKGHDGSGEGGGGVTKNRSLNHTINLISLFMC